MSTILLKFLQKLIYFDLQTQFFLNETAFIERIYYSKGESTNFYFICSLEMSDKKPAKYQSMYAFHGRQERLGTYVLKITNRKTQMIHHSLPNLKKALNLEGTVKNQNK